MPRSILVAARRAHALCINYSAGAVMTVKIIPSSGMVRHASAALSLTAQMSLRVCACHPRAGT